MFTPRNEAAKNLKETLEAIQNRSEWTTTYGRTFFQEVVLALCPGFATKETISRKMAEGIVDTAVEVCRLCQEKEKKHGE